MEAREMPNDSLQRIHARWSIENDRLAKAVEDVVNRNGDVLTPVLDAHRDKRPRVYCGKRMQEKAHRTDALFFNSREYGIVNLLTFLLLRQKGQPRQDARILTDRP